MVDSLIYGLQAMLQAVKKSFWGPRYADGLPSTYETLADFEHAGYLVLKFHYCRAYERRNNAAIACGEAMPGMSDMPMTEIDRQPSTPGAVARMKTIKDRMNWAGDPPPQVPVIMLIHAMLDNLERWNDARPEDISPIRIEEVTAWVERWIFNTQILLWRRDNGATPPPTITLARQWDT